MSEHEPPIPHYAITIPLGGRIEIRAVGTSEADRRALAGDMTDRGLGSVLNALRRAQLSESERWPMPEHGEDAD